MNAERAKVKRGQVNVKVGEAAAKVGIEEESYRLS